MIEQLLKKLELSNSKLLKMSFTHSSFLNENLSNTDLESNERLEFLGDSVISFIVAEYIYEKTGIKNFLIGESLLKSDNPSELMKKLIQITQ